MRAPTTLPSGRSHWDGGLSSGVGTEARTGTAGGFFCRSRQWPCLCQEDGGRCWVSTLSSCPEHGPTAAGMPRTSLSLAGCPGLPSVARLGTGTIPNRGCQGPWLGHRG